MQNVEEKTSILIIEDDQTLQQTLAYNLNQEGYAVSVASDGQTGLDLARSLTPDLVVLDIMLPGLQGLDVLQRLRQFCTTPVLMLTARGDESDRVVGHELGADDYVPKPFSPRELLARLRAVLRRTEPEAGASRLSVQGVELDVAARTVRVEGSEVELTGLEFDILHALLRRAGRVVPRAALLEEAGRGDVTVNDRTVDVHISHLRKKLGDPQKIRTVRGVGYVFARDAMDS